MTVKVAPPGSRGDRFEQTACDYLQARGLRLVERNYRAAVGEIDLIMRDRDVLVFVEVRFRRHAGFGSAAESVDARKRAKLRATAEHYLQRQRGACPPCRFDVVAVSPTVGGERVEWLQNAFAQD